MPKAMQVKGVDLSLELLLWRAYGNAGNTSDMLSRSLALNPGLSAAGAVIPLLTTVMLADLPAAKKPDAQVSGVDLFGD